MIKQDIVQNAPVGVPLLPPGVREVDEEPGDRSARKESREHCTRVVPKHAHVWKISFFPTLFDEKREFLFDFDSNNSVLAGDFRATEKEGPATETDFDFDLGSAWQQVLNRDVPVGESRCDFAVSNRLGRRGLLHGQETITPRIFLTLLACSRIQLNSFRRFSGHLREGFVPLTILAVDDSATMRRVIEMTFAAENARVITLPAGASAVDTAVAEKVDVILADASLDGVDGYAIAQKVKANAALSHVRVIVMASQHTPYDDQKGRASGVDDHIIKPFDTQGLIDRVNRLAGAAPKAAAAPGAAAAPRPAPPPPNTRPQIPLPPTPTAPAAVAPSFARSADQPRSQTLKMGSEPPPPMRPAAAAVTASVNGNAAQMSEKLAGLGLTSQQADAVMALSREVVERVVWEVVPDLAEAIIREELKRLVSE